MLHREISIMWILIRSVYQTSLSEDTPAVYCLVPGRKYSVGRGACDLIINIQSVSGKHATISVRDSDKTSQVWIIDHSRFGTFVNSEQLLKSERQIFSGDELVFGKWICATQAYTYSLSWSPIVLCCSSRGESMSSLRTCVSKYDVTLLDNWDDRATHVVVNELRTTIKVLCGLSKGIPIVRQSWVDQLICSIENFTPLPNPSEHIPDLPEGYEISDVSLFDVNLKRRILFEGKSFYFLNIQDYELFHIPISYCGGTSTLVDISDVNFATFDRYAAVDSVVVSRKFDKFCSAEGGTEFISQLQLTLEAEGKAIVTDYSITHSIIKVTTDFITALPPTSQSNASEQCSAPPESSDKSDVLTQEFDDESLPQRKKPKVEVHSFPSDDQSTCENINDLFDFNKSSVSSPIESRKQLTELKLNQEENTPATAVDNDTYNPQVSKRELPQMMNGRKVLRKCFIKHHVYKGVTYIKPLVPYVSGTNGLIPSSEEENDFKSESMKQIMEPIRTSSSRPCKSVKLEMETTQKNTSKVSGEFHSPSRKSTWIVIDSSDEDDTFLSIAPL